MLEKPIINQEDFKILETYIEKYKTVNQRDSCCIAIDSKWGNGKTEFITVWKSRLEKSDNTITIYYDAWEYDTIESPLLPILVKLACLVEEKDDQEFLAYTKEFIKASFTSVIKYSTEKYFGEKSPVSLLLNEGIDAVKEYKVSDYYTELEKESSVINNLSKKIKELISKSGKTIYFFIDELDRCKPDFAVRTLESINHFFSYPQVTYVFAADVEQISFSIKNIYGSEIDSFRYMRKFFNIIYSLNTPKLSEYIMYVFSEETTTISLNRNITSYICNLLQQFDFSLQDINYICKHICIFLNHYSEHLEKNTTAIEYYLYFLIIRHMYYLDYKKIVRGEFSLQAESSIKKLIVKYPENLDELFKMLANNGGIFNREDIISKFNLLRPKNNIPFYEYMNSVLNYNRDFLYT